MTDPSSQLRYATRRAKSDVANKLISMLLHELSRTVCRDWTLKADSEQYVESVRRAFGNRCPYCDVDLRSTPAVVEHLDGMNRYRLGLHVPGNVLVSCRKCNNEKRRDDSLPKLTLASSGWESFLAHNGRCVANCKTCQYWIGIWPDESDRSSALAQRAQAIREFRLQFPKLQIVRARISAELADSVSLLYSDCQNFAEQEIAKLLRLVATYPAA